MRIHDWYDQPPSDARREVTAPGVPLWKVAGLAALASLLMRGNLVRLKGGATLELDPAVRFQGQAIEGGVELHFDSGAGGVTQPILTLPHQPPTFVRCVRLVGRDAVAVLATGKSVAFRV